MNIDKKSNVVILFIDDLGFGDLGCFGNKRIPAPITRVEARSRKAGDGKSVMEKRTNEVSGIEQAEARFG